MEYPRVSWHPVPHAGSRKMRPSCANSQGTGPPQVSPASLKKSLHAVLKSHVTPEQMGYICLFLRPPFQALLPPRGSLTSLAVRAQRGRVICQEGEELSLEVTLGPCWGPFAPNTPTAVRSSSPKLRRTTWKWGRQHMLRVL